MNSLFTVLLTMEDIKIQQINGKKIKQTLAPSMYLLFQTKNILTQGFIEAKVRKVQKYVSARKPSMKLKDNLQNGRKYLQIMQPTKG